MKKRLKIFIGTSSLYAPYGYDKKIDRNISNEELASQDDYKLAHVFAALLNAGLEPCPWWRGTIWNDAESFLDSLIEASERYDGGIFILGPDDPIDDYNVSDDSYAVTRNNVVFEFGMFLAAKGRKRAYAIFDKDSENGNKLKQMTDLLGIEYPSLDDQKLEEKIKKFFGVRSRDHRLECVTMHANPKIWNVLQNHEYQKWSTKGLFIGSRSSQLWDKIESHNEYEVYSSLTNNFIVKINEIIKNFGESIDNIVSFRPGSGRIDHEWVTKISKHNNTIGYIPVDINPHLMFMAANHVNKDGLIDVPFMIVDDFEEHHHYLSAVIKNNASSIGQYNLFSMLGSTFSNLERKEDYFFSKIKDWMKEGDYFLFDVGLYGAEKDKEGYTADGLKTILLERHGDKPDYASLLMNAIVKKHSEHYAYPGPGIPVLVDPSSMPVPVLHRLKDSTNIPLRDIVEVQQIDEKDVEGYSNLRSTKVFVCKLNGIPNVPELLIFREYKFHELKKVLEEDFDVESLDGLSDLGSIKVNRGCFLLRKKDSENYQSEMRP